MTYQPRDIHLCPLCLMPMLSASGGKTQCACDEAERRGIALPDDQNKTDVAYRYAVVAYQSALRQIGLMP